MFRSRRQDAVEVVPTKDYKVLVSFSDKHVMVPVGTILSFTDAQAKYHLLAGRVELVVDAPAPAPAPAPFFAPAPAPAPVSDTSSDSSKK